MISGSLFPVFVMIVKAAVLKHFNLTGDLILKSSDRLVFFPL